MSNGDPYSLTNVL